MKRGMIAGLLVGIAAGYSQAPPVVTPGVALVYTEPIRRVPAEYTPEARAAGLQGSVILCLTIDGFGRLEAVQVIQHLGFGLDEKAVDAVRQWQFKPSTVDGKPVRVKQSAEVRFVLNPAPSWRVMRTAYSVVRRPKERVQEMAPPVLTQYAPPDDASCAAGGGGATIEAKIAKQGQSAELNVLEQHGEVAAKAATEAMARWRFQPGRMNGAPRESVGTFLLECRSGGPEDMDDAGPPAKVGNGVSAPVVVYKIEPEYSDLARKAKLQGSVTVALRVNPSGRATRMCIAQPLGMGLDEKAMEAINQWRFRPGMKDGKAVTVPATVQVQFRLL